MDYNNGLNILSCAFIKWICLTYRYIGRSKHSRGYPGKEMLLDVGGMWNDILEVNKKVVLPTIKFS